MLSRLRTPARTTACIAARVASYTRFQRAFSAGVSFGEDDGESSYAQKGFRLRSIGSEFALLAPALAAFHRTTGHFIVPYHFPIPRRRNASGKLIQRTTVSRIDGVPDDPRVFDWPEEVEDLNLGRVLHKFATNPRYHQRYPMVVSDLHDIGFPIDEDWKAYVWDKMTVTPLKVFYNREGHSMVPTTFVIPHGDPRWPRFLWGYRLGKRVHRLRVIYDTLNLAELEDLEQVEFVHDLADVTWTERILPALRAYKAVHGDCLVKRTFVVPSHEPWPEKTWGLNLGVAVNSMRSKNAYREQILRDAAQLEEIKFVWNHREIIWKDGLLPALEVFHRIHGHSRIPRNFVVPSSDPWPRTAWDHALGVTVNHIRSKGAYKQEIQEDLNRINAISFIWSMREYRWRELILPSLEVFADRYGHCRIPRDFIVPSHDPWPEDAWGMALGSLAYGIRYYGSYASFVSEDEQHLRIIGFM